MPFSRPTPYLPKRGAAKRRSARGRRCAMETLESRQMLDAGPVISEFMAVNHATLA
ncbi:MAG: hypothetical protein HQ567_13000, partial [Candidatus Nealsonbacteria bacterium]|nr:hypothetical protein [Candidatus Nealsonbacteria bacterium]